MSVFLLGQSGDGTIVFLVIGGIFVAVVIALVIANLHEQKKEDNKPKSRSLGFAPRDQPKPEPKIPDTIRPATEEYRQRPRRGPVEPPPDAELPAPPPKLLPPRDSE